MYNIKTLKTKTMTKMEKINEILDSIINECQLRIEKMNESIETNTVWQIKQAAKNVRDKWITRKEQTKFIKYELNKENL